MHHALASRGMSHEDNLAFIVTEFVSLVFMYILQTLSNLVSVSIEMPETPGLVGRSEAQCE